MLHQRSDAAFILLCIMPIHNYADFLYNAQLLSRVICRNSNYLQQAMFYGLLALLNRPRYNYYASSAAELPFLGGEELKLDCMGFITVSLGWNVL